MPGAGRSEPRAAGAGLAHFCPSPASEPSAGPKSAPLLFYSGHSGTLEANASLSSIKACGAMLWAPLPLQSPFPTSVPEQCPAAAQNPSPWPCTSGRMEGPYVKVPPIQSLTIVLLHSPTVPFPRWGWCWKHSSTPEFSQQSPRAALTLRTRVGVHWRS